MVQNEARRVVNKQYVGHRPNGSGTIGVTVNVVVDGEARELPLRLDLYSHSPSGFEWGYGGSGPSQLALAILADATGDDQYALAHRHDYKRDVIQNLPSEDWKLSLTQVVEWVLKHHGDGMEVKADG